MARVARIALFALLLIAPALGGLPSFDEPPDFGAAEAPLDLDDADEADPADVAVAEWADGPVVNLQGTPHVRDCEPPQGPEPLAVERPPNVA